jgi:hypothetical protein
LTTVDVPSTDFIVNQTTFYLALIITLGSAAAVIYQAIRGVNKRIRKGREEAEAKMDVKIEELRKEIVDLKERSDYLQHKIIDGFFDQKGKDNQ